MKRLGTTNIGVKANADKTSSAYRIQKQENNCTCFSPRYTSSYTDLATVTAT